MTTDGFDRYVGLWEMMIAAGVPDTEIHTHIDGLIERLENRRDELLQRHPEKTREITDIERALDELAAAEFGSR